MSILSLIETGVGMIDKLIPDRKAAKKAKAEMERLLVEAENAGRLGQIEINKMEAAHQSLFVAGWRPGIGWACAIGIAWLFVVQPIASWLMIVTGGVDSLPHFPTEYVMEMTLAMLGMGGLRTFEKMRGIAREK